VDGVREEVGRRVDAAGEKVRSRFCERFAETAGNMTKRMADVRSRFEQRKESFGNPVADRRITSDENLNRARSDQDSRRLDWYAGLDERVTTDEEREAVEKFRETVDAAVETRREAVDAAVETFRDGVDALLAERRAAAESIADGFEKEIDEAVAVMKARCESGDDPETLRNAFQETLGSVKERVHADRESIADADEQIAALSEVRDAAITAASETFQDALDTAADALNEVLSPVSTE
jgi:hypothetical protein